MYSTPFVVLLGMGTVFVGLILIIFLCKIMSFFVNITDKTDNAVKSTPASAPTPAPNNTIENKGSLLAAVSAVVAEELGTDISNIRIHSIKRV